MSSEGPIKGTIPVVSSDEAVIGSLYYKESASWLRSYWRPLLAITYMVVILFDFVLAPIGWSLIQYYAGGDIAMQWEPLTLSQGGLLHMSISAVLGVSAWTRGQEKVEKIKSKTSIVNND